MPQHTDTTSEDEYIHIQQWADCNKLLINTSKTKEIVFKRPSLRQYVPPHPLTYIEHFDLVKLLGLFFTPTITTCIHINSVIAVMNQRLYLLNQLRKQGLDIRGLTQIFMGLVVARFHYALPAIAGQISVNDLNRIDAVFTKAFRWQLTSIVPSAAEIVDNADKNYSTPPLILIICPQPHSSALNSTHLPSTLLICPQPHSLLKPPK